MSADLQDLRVQIDEIDQKLIDLLAERFKVTSKVGAYKRDNQLPAADPEREARQMKRIIELAEQNGVDPEFATKFLRLIIDEVVRNNQSYISEDKS